MQIVIPMSGFGNRFREAGYSVPKPLIPVDDRTIIEHVINLYPGETNFTFVCSEDHINEEAYRMRDILSSACPSGNIISIASHKLGPIHAVQQIIGDLILSEPTIVNYCDFSQYWDWNKFKKFVSESECDGCIPSYKGFHPHSLNGTYYAYLKLDKKNECVIDIREKQPWTNEPTKEYASSGTYYFKSADLMKSCLHRCIEEKLSVNGEYYVSMAFRPMAYDQLKILPYELEYFMQWGTPQDLQEYQKWDRLFRRYKNGIAPSSTKKIDGNLIVPMAGLGSRFQEEGYADPKPLIKVDNLIMASRAIKDMPQAENITVVTRKDLPKNELIKDTISKEVKNVKFVTLEKLTEGQAISCLQGVMEFGEDQLDKLLTVAACDNGVIYDEDKLEIKLKEADCLVWGVSGHAAAIRKPKSYSWIAADENGIVSEVGVKKTVGDISTDSIVIGAFSFKTARIFREALNRMVDCNDRVNGEFYVDGVINHLIALGKTVKMFPVDHFVSFGTPDELKTYNYWRDCFKQWQYHPLQDFAE